MAAEACVSQGAKPIFLTPFPRDAAGMTVTQVVPWRRLRTSIMALRQAGAIVLDATSLLGKSSCGQLDGTFLLGYSDDRTIRMIMDMPQLPPN